MPPVRAIVALALLPLTSLADPADEAFEALADGRDRAAVAILERALAGGEDSDLRCLLGRIEHRRGAHADALVALAAVPDDAACARAAAWTRAEALRALGRVDEAADLYGELGERALGDDRAAATAARLVALADRILGQEVPNVSQAVRVLVLALELQTSAATRLAIARQLADVAVDHRTSAPAAVPYLAAAVGRPGDDADRRRLAALLAPADGLALLEPLPETPATLAARVALAERLGDRAALPLVRRLIAAFPEAAETRAARHRLGRRLAAAGWVVEARELLGAIAEGFDEDAADAAWTLLKLSIQSDDTAAALVEARDFVTRFPRSAVRGEAETAVIETLFRLGREQADAGRHGDAIATFDEIVRTLPRDPRAATAAYEAGLAARAAGEGDEARRRLAEVVARWPGADASRLAVEAVFRLIAVDGDDPAAATAWLEERAAAGVRDAATVLEQTEEVEIAVEAPAGVTGRTIPVRVVTRNLTEVEARLHRIDTEAWLRDGGEADELPDLDIEVVAPDRRWTAPVPDPRPRRRQSWVLPVEVPGPGIYAVTVGTTDRAARTIALVSDARLVGHRVDDKIAIAVFRGDRPAPEARLWLRGITGTQTARTDRTGTAVLDDVTGPVTILAETPGGPAILELAAPIPGDVAPEQPLAVDLDRAAYRPGDDVRFRIATAPGSTGATWHVWIEGAGVHTPVVHEITQEPDGSVIGSIPLPLAHPPVRSLASPIAGGRLMVRRPHATEAETAATFQVSAPVPQGRSLHADIDGTEATIEVREDDGRPAADVPVTWVWSEGERDGILRTDATGRVRLQGPPAGVPWTVRASITGTDLHARAARPPTSLPSFQVRARQERLHPGERAVVQLEGRGRATVRLVRVATPDPGPSAATDPWGLDVAPGLKGERLVWSSWTGDVAPDGLRTTIREVEIDVEGTTEADLGEVGAGAYLVEVGDVSGRSGIATMRLTAVPGLRLTPTVTAGPGQPVAVGVEGRAALVTIQGGRDLRARVLLPGERLEVAVPSDWGDDAVVRAVSGRGESHTRTVAVDNRLEVDLTVAEEGPEWTVRAVVTDAAGNPVPGARVVLRAVDPVVERWAGVAASIGAGPLHWRTTPGWSGGAAISMSHGAWSTAIAAALLAEAEREAERRKARRALEGRLGDNALRDVLAAEVPLYQTGMGMGAVGSGYGGGGSSSHGGGGIGRAGDPIVLGASRPRPHPGDWAQVLWHVGTTAADGAVTHRVPRPQGRAAWRIDAIAVHGAVAGRDAEVVRTDDEPSLAAPRLVAGTPGESARPRVAVINGGAQPLVGQVAFAGRSVAVEVAPGQSVGIDVGDVRPGDEVEVVLRDGTGILARHDLAWPAIPWATTSGQETTVAIGPGGGAPFAWLALADDPIAAYDAGRAAIAARSALAALPRLSGSAAAEVTERIERILVALPTRADAYDDVGDLAQAIAALAEGRDRIGFDPRALAAFDDDIPTDTATRAERVALLFARARAGLRVGDAATSRLIRYADELDDEQRSELAHALVLLDRRDEARRLVAGDGPHAVLARIALGARPKREALLATSPPLPGDPARPAWIAALPDRARRPATGVLDVAVGGVSAGRIDVVAGGVVTAPGAGAVEGLGKIPALVFRSGPVVAHDPTVAARLPGEADALPARASTPAPGAGDLQVHCSPCTIPVGDALRVVGNLERAAVPAGLVRMGDPSGGQLLLGAVAGTWVVRGIRTADGPADLEVTVGAASPTPLAQSVAVRIATQAAAAGDDPGRWLADRPDLEAWSPGLRATIARIAFARAVAANTDVTIAFEDLRDLAPAAHLDFASVAATARAYRVDHADRAIDVWRAGIEASFLEEASVATRLEPIVGSLASIQVLREIAARYPQVDVVEEALFDLPDRLAEIGETELPAEVRDVGVTGTDVRLMVAAWSREFLALNPDSELAPQAGLRLATGLLHLGASRRAAQWAARIAADHPAHPLRDRLLYVEALALSDLGERRRARQRLRDVIDGQFWDGDGNLRDAVARDDARLALARLKEADGDREGARRDYLAARSGSGEATASLTVLERRTLTGGNLIVVHGGEPITLPLTTAGIDAISLRAYALDLRTLFLRDGGLDTVRDVRIAGVAPVWEAERRVRARSFPTNIEVDVPLSRPGAYLVHVAAGGRRVTALVVRTDLEIDAVDAGDRRRLTVLRRGRAAPDLQVRAVGQYGRIIAAETDVRGVAMVPAWAAALVYDGDHVAFTTGGGRVAGGDAEDELIERLDADLRALRVKTRESFDHIGARRLTGVEVEEL